MKGRGPRYPGRESRKKDGEAGGGCSDGGSGERAFEKLWILMNLRKKGDRQSHLGVGWGGVWKQGFLCC